MLYMQGRYNYEAFQSVMSAFSWGLGGRKGAKPDPYRSYPIPITSREQEAERQRSIVATLAWVKKGQEEG